MPKKQKAKIKQKNKCPEKLIRTEAAKEIAAVKKKSKEEVKLAKLKARKKMFTKEELQNLD